MLTLLALFACTPDALDGVASFPGDAWLGPNAADITTHTRVTSLGDARLTPGGEPLVDVPDPGDIDWTLPAVDAGSRVRIRTQAQGIDLLLWLDRDNLVDVVRVSARVTAAGLGKDGVGVLLPAGTPVDGATAKGAWMHLKDERLEATVDVPASDVDQVWEDGPGRPMFGDYDATVRDGATLLDAPGGQAFAVVHGGDVHTVDKRDGWRLVDVVPDAWAARGWVAEADVVVPDGIDGGYGWSCGCCCGGSVRWGSSRPPTIPSGAWLRASPGGDVVGRATQDLWLPVDHEGGAVAVDVSTDWGTARLYWTDGDVDEAR